MMTESHWACVQEERLLNMKLQERLSERRQQCVDLQEELNDLGFAYDMLRESHIRQSERINYYETQSFGSFLRDWWHRLIVGCCEDPDSYYGLDGALAKRDVV